MIGVLFSVYPGSANWLSPLGRFFLRVQKWAFWPLSMFYWVTLRYDGIRDLFQRPKETKIDRFLLPLITQNDSAYQVYSPGHGGTFENNFAKGYFCGIWIKADEQYGAVQHFALEVSDIRTVRDSLQKRGHYTDLQVRAHVGNSKHWLVHVFDPDGSRTEIMESAIQDKIPAMTVMAWAELAA